MIIIPLEYAYMLVVVGVQARFLMT